MQRDLPDNEQEPPIGDPPDDSFTLRRLTYRIETLTADVAQSRRAHDALNELYRGLEQQTEGLTAENERLVLDAGKAAELLRELQAKEEALSEARRQAAELEGQRDIWKRRARWWLALGLVFLAAALTWLLIAAGSRQ